MGKLNGKVGLVTGAAKGLGASIAEHLAAEGASVVVNYATSKAAAETVVSRIEKKAGRRLRFKGTWQSLRILSGSFSRRRRPTAGWTFW